MSKFRNENFIKNLTSILEKESMEFIDTQSQEDKLEEETIYTKNIGYKDSLIMNDFFIIILGKKNGLLLKSLWIMTEIFLQEKHIFREFTGLFTE